MKIKVGRKQVELKESQYLINIPIVPEDYRYFQLEASYNINTGKFDPKYNGPTCAFIATIGGFPIAGYTDWLDAIDRWNSQDPLSQIPDMCSTWCCDKHHCANGRSVSSDKERIEEGITTYLLNNQLEKYSRLRESLNLIIEEEIDGLFEYGQDQLRDRFWGASDPRLLKQDKAKLLRQLTVFSNKVEKIKKLIKQQWTSKIKEFEEEFYLAKQEILATVPKHLLDSLTAQEKKDRYY